MLLLLLFFIIIILLVLLLVSRLAEISPMQTQDDSFFDHEKLDVYREAIAFAAWLSALLDSTWRVARRVKKRIVAGDRSGPAYGSRGLGLGAGS